MWSSSSAAANPRSRACCSLYFRVRCLFSIRPGHVLGCFGIALSRPFLGRGGMIPAWPSSRATVSDGCAPTDSQYLRERGGRGSEVSVDERRNARRRDDNPRPRASDDGTVRRRARAGCALYALDLQRQVLVPVQLCAGRRTRGTPSATSMGTRWGTRAARCDGGGGGSFAALAHRATDRSARRSRGASRPSARARPRRGCGRTACSGARGARGGCGRPWRPVATRGGAARCGRVASSENAHSLHSAARKQTSSSPRRFFEPLPRRAGTRPAAARPWTIDRSSECGAGRSSTMKP